MVLLSELSQLLPSKQLVVAHFNHHTQTPYCEEAERLVQKTCQQLSLHFQKGARRGTSVSENALRLERLSFLKRTREQEKADFILTAHTANDQLETVLMRLLRGTGLRGLSGIHPQRGSFLRPFLTLSRSEIEKIARRNKITFVQDPTNTQPIYLRNRVRKLLVPPFLELSHEFGGPEATLARLSDLCAEMRLTKKELNRQTKALFESLVTQTSFWFRMSQDRFSKLSVFWRKGLVVFVYRKLKVTVPDRRAVEEILDSISKKRSLSAQHGVDISFSCGVIYFQTTKQKENLAKMHNFTKWGKQLVCADLEASISVSDPFKDTELRFFRSGDKWGGKKLKRLWLENRIPRLERKILPVLARGFQVVWFYPQKHEGVNAQVGFPFSHPLEII